MNKTARDPQSEPLYELARALQGQQGIRQATVEDFTLDSTVVDGYIHVYTDPKLGGKAGLIIKKELKKWKRRAFSLQVVSPRQNYPSRVPKGVKIFGRYEPPAPYELEKFYADNPYVIDAILYHNEGDI